MGFDVFGLGNALVDALVVLDEGRLLAENGLDRGTMHLVDDARWRRLFEGVPADRVVVHPGGSCANAVSTVARLGGRASFCGLVGTDDLGDRYDAGLRCVLGDHWLRRRPGAPTGKCLSLVSEVDAERTMVTDLGTAMDLREDEVPLDVVAGAGWLHETGYMFTGGRMGSAAFAALDAAKAAGVRISFDVADTFVVEHFRATVDRVIGDYADLVFMNREEGRAIAGTDPDQAAEILGHLAPTVVVKLGRHGSFVLHGGERIPIEAVRVEAVDTTGAGDTYAGGFLYGLSQGWPLDACGRLASAVAALTVCQVGGVVRDVEAIRRVRDGIARLL